VPPSRSPSPWGAVGGSAVTDRTDPATWRLGGAPGVLQTGAGIDDFPVGQVQAVVVG